MSTTPRNLSRFLPTLTEVVHPSSLTRTAAQATPNLEEIVQSVMPQVELVLKRRLSEEAEAMVRTLVTEQLHALNTRLYGELEIVVRHAVMEAMTSRFDQHKSK